jgi:hypothetical protein
MKLVDKKYLIAVLFLTGACANIGHDINRQPWLKSNYEKWHGEVCACLEKYGYTPKGKFDRIRFYIVPDNSLGDYAGWWEKIGDDSLAIHTIMVERQHKNDIRLVKHELLHDITESGEHGKAFEDCNLLRTRWEKQG